MPKLIDLTNNKYGNWLVINKAQSKSGKTYWHCRCQVCGEEKDIQGTHLKNNTYADHCKEEELFIKRCCICNKEFQIKEGGYARKYCYDCSPSYKHGDNRDRQIAITNIRNAIKKQLIFYKRK